MPLQAIFAVIDTIVEIYLRTVIRPFLEFHDIFYAALNRFCRSQLDAHHVPAWFTANFITYFRTALVIPTILVLSWSWWPVASAAIIFVDFGDFLDGVVARYWVDKRAESKAKKMAAQKKNESDEDGFGESYCSRKKPFACIHEGIYGIREVRRCRVPTYSINATYHLFPSLCHSKQSWCPSAARKLLLRGGPTTKPRHTAALSTRSVTRCTWYRAGYSSSRLCPGPHFASFSTLPCGALFAPRRRQGPLGSAPTLAPQESPLLM